MAYFGKGLELRTPDTQPSDLGSKEEVESEQTFAVSPVFANIVRARERVSGLRPGPEPAAPNRCAFEFA